MENLVRKSLTAEDCITLKEAGFEIEINDGLPYVTNRLESDEESYYTIPDEFAVPLEPAFS